MHKSNNCNFRMGFCSCYFLQYVTYDTKCLSEQLQLWLAWQLQQL